MTLSVALTHRFGTFALDLAFEAPAGVTALFGRSGSGKSTVVKAVAGLFRPQGGRVAVDGEVLCDTDRSVCLPPHRRRVGCVFQEPRLFPHLSVRQNLLYGRWFARRRGDGVGGELDRVVALLGIEALLARTPMGLSGGEQARVALGRALLARPRMLVLDEPLAALDAARKAEILPYLERLRDEAGVPILYVSHSVVEVARLANEVVVLEAGRILRQGSSAELLADPEAVPALGVRAAGSLLTGEVAAHHTDGLTEVAVSAGRILLPRVEAPVGARLRIRIEAQDVILALSPHEDLSALNRLEGRVVAVRRGDGPGAVVQLAVGDELLLARVTRRSADRLGLVPGTRCYAFAKSVSVAPGDIGHL